MDDSDDELDQSIDTGAIEKAASHTYVLNPKSPLPISFKGCTLTEAQAIKSVLQTAAQSPWNVRSEQLAFLIARHNLTCPELEDFIFPIRKDVTEKIDRACQDSSEWKRASEKDRSDLIFEFRKLTVEELPVKPSNEHAFETLLFRAPNNVAVDNEVLNRFSTEEYELYPFYIRNLERGSKAIRVSANHHNRKKWEALVKFNLAKRGKDIDVKTLLSMLRMKDINELFADRLQKRFTRKAHAVEFAVQQVDVLDVLSRQIAFREMFQISHPEEIDVAEVTACYEYALAQASIIRDTYLSGYRTMEKFQSSAESASVEGWTIDSGNCCQACARLDGKKTKNKPRKTPPFHMGCTCELQYLYFWD